MKCVFIIDPITFVTDGREGVCADPGRRDATLGAGGPGPQEEAKSSSWFWTVEEERHSSMTRNKGDGLATTSRGSYAQSECCCALYKQIM
jgi:hypothetical protein